MKTVRIHIQGLPHNVVEGRGATIASAVQRAAHKLFNRPGRSERVARRIDTHTYEWHWRIGRVVHALHVCESRSGPSGKGTKRQVQLRLSDADAERLDGLADRRGLDRSALVVSLVDEALKTG